MKTQKLYWGKTIASFFLVLFTMPLGHALMRVMEDTMSPHAVNVSAFIMGAVGLAIAIWGVFVKGDTKQTLFGLFGGKRDEIVPRNMSRHTAITTFMELNIMMWTMYLLLMFVYDPVFLGESHPVTIAIAIGCLVGSIFMFKYELKLGGWGPNLRMAVSTVVIFWTTVEVFARNGLFTEFWVDPLAHIPEMVSILATFLLLGAFLLIRSRRKKDAAQ